MDFIVDGKPQGKQRPRFSRISKTVYTPNKTAKYEKQIAKAYTDSGGKCIPADCYVSVTVCAFFLSLSPTPRVNGWHASTMSTGLIRSRI